MERKATARNLSTSDLAGVERKPLLDDGSAGVEPVALEKSHDPSLGESQAGQNVQEKPTPLVDNAAAEDFQHRWNDIQVSFVDQPREAVEQADHLVAETMKRLAESFAKERNGLESQWDRGDQVSTEDLRQALQKYRSFFHRLLAA